MAGKIHVTVKEKILIHLLNYSKYRDQFEVPSQVSQGGIANAIGVRRSHIASALKDLREREQVEERKSRIQGEGRRKNAYFLTHVGQGEAFRLKESILQKKIMLRTEDGAVKELGISEVNKHIKEKLGVLEILNRLSEEGVFDAKSEGKEALKDEAEPKALERIVLCPFCRQSINNFELRPVQLGDGATGFSVSCMYCGKDFIAVEMDTPGLGIEKGYVASYLPYEGFPGYYYPSAKPVRDADVFLVSLGLLFMLAAFSLMLLVSFAYLPGAFLIAIPLCFIASLTLLYVGLKDVKYLDMITRRILIVTGAVFVGFIALFLGLMTDAEYDGEQALIMVSVVLPAFGVFIFGKPLAKSLRSELSLSLGVFFVLFGIVSIAFHDMFSWQASFSPFWVIAGVVMILTSYEIERLEKTFKLRAVCVGAGAFIAVFCLMVLISYSSLGLFKVISAILWLLFGVFLVLIRFLRKDSCEKMFKSLRSALLSGLGVLFVLIGILLALNGRYMECAVEFFIGIPIIWYGLTKKGEYTPSLVGTIAFIIASEAFTVFSFILS